MSAARDVILLDGRALATQREPEIARRARAVQAARGRAPTLLLAAFRAEDGRVPHIGGKLRTCERVGLHAEALVLDAREGTSPAVARLTEEIAAVRPDAVFVQVPCPAGIDEGALLAAVPAELDVDIMTAARAGAFLRGDADLPPVTVTGALLLLDAHDVSVRGRTGVVVGEPSVYASMIVEAFRRRGAVLVDVVPPAADLHARLASAELVIAAAAQPGAVAGDMLADGSIALDFGYFNEGARGDIDTTAGIAHLHAFMPVPGGVGPMTVSALVERVVAFAGG